MKCELIGKIQEIGQREVVGDNLEKQFVVIWIDSKFPRAVMVQSYADKCQLLEPFQVGHKVKCTAFPHSKEGSNKWKGTWFTELRLARIERYGGKIREEEPQGGQSADFGDDEPF